MANLFERLNKGRLPEPELSNKQLRQPPRRRADPRLLLMDLLEDGPMLAAAAQAHGAAHGLSKKQLKRAREKMQVRSFKQVGVPNGPWVWVLPQHS